MTEFLNSGSAESPLKMFMVHTFIHFVCNVFPYFAFRQGGLVEMANFPDP